MTCLQPRPIGVTTPSGLLPSRRPLPGHAHGAARNGARASARFQVCPLPNGTLVQVACGCGRDRKARRCYSAVRRRHRLFECNRTESPPSRWGHEHGDAGDGERPAAAVRHETASRSSRDGRRHIIILAVAGGTLVFRRIKRSQCSGAPAGRRDTRAPGGR
ncbi:hypothetical protein PVAP13_3KG288427 [Panicum virgatum]|uniref:Uncharacterized protein n=1 Tax=Panicum virgatum TaxID=38727 RepID=A0A8T0UV54_PANVG|nr:hypothetical protein PVAP13_3KG288427 [Panicum virgatum]